MKTSLLNRHATDVVNYLLAKHGVKLFYYRAYIRKSEDKFDEEIPATDLSDLSQIYNLYKSKDPRYLISFQSKVCINDSYKHIPMIDFSNKIIKDLNREQIKKILQQLGETKGFILDSGRCFHYYGDRLLSEKDWLIFVKKCATFEAIGEGYISHQIRRGKSSLRLVTDDSKPKNPIVVEEFGF